MDRLSTHLFLCARIFPLSYAYAEGLYFLSVIHVHVSIDRWDACLLAYLFAYLPREAFRLLEYVGRINKYTPLGGGVVRARKKFFVSWEKSLRRSRD